MAKAGYFSLAIPLTELGSAAHHLFIREHHTGASSSSGKTKTLFVGNVDLLHAMSHEDIGAYLRELFAPLGEVESVSVSSFADAQGKQQQLQQQQQQQQQQDQGGVYSMSTPSRFAHLQFAKASTVKAILHAVTSGMLASSTSVAQITRRWGLGSVIKLKTSKELRDSHPFVDVDRSEMKREVDQAMAEFEEQEQLARLERERASRRVDEDGFMPVQHRKKRKRQSEVGGRQGGSGSVSAVGRNRPNKKKALLESSAIVDGTVLGQSGEAQEGKQVKSLKNFYGFQQKEDKQNTLLRLRRQFEQDREKVAKLREQRKFKPF